MQKKVKSTTLYRHDLVIKDINAKNAEWESYKYSYTEFDKDGKVILETKYLDDGEIEEKYEYLYNNNGKLIEEIDYMDEDEVATRKKYSRDDSGKITEAKLLYQDGTEDTTLYIYNDSGKLIEVKTIDEYDEVDKYEKNKYENEKLVLKELYEYDELMQKDDFFYHNNGKIKKTSRWTAENELTHENFFDGSGNFTGSKILRPQGEVLARTENKIEEGRIIEITEHSTRGVISTKITYDDKGNAVLQEEKDEEGNVLNTAQRSFNDNNDVIETKVFIDFRGRAVNQQYILKYEYQYL